MLIGQMILANMKCDFLVCSLDDEFEYTCLKYIINKKIRPYIKVIIISKQKRKILRQEYSLLKSKMVGTRIRSRKNNFSQ